MIVSKARIRVLMVCRTYWPHLWSDVASRSVRLADGLARAGIDVNVLTPRYGTSWPAEIVHREILVHRPFDAPRSDWSMGRYLRNVEMWLRSHAAQYDVIYCSAIREESALVVEAAQRLGSASVLHHGGTGDQADAVYSIASRHRRRVTAAIAGADAIVLPRASAEQAMVVAGYSPSRFRRIAMGISPGTGSTGRDAVARVCARQALAAINGDLKTNRDSMVVTTFCRMSDSAGLMKLAHAIPDLVTIWPDLRFWLIGDGPLRGELHRYFKHHSVRENIAMPGTFVDFADVLMASDVYVQPSANDGLDDFVFQALAAPLPIVMADATDTRGIIGRGDDVAWFQSDDGGSLHRAMRGTLVDLATAQATAEQLRRNLLKQRPLSETIGALITLICELSGKPLPSATASASRSPG